MAKETNDQDYTRIIELLDINEKLIKEKFEEYNIFNKEQLLDKNLGEKINTNLIDNNTNNEDLYYSNEISFRNNQK